jgi:nucleoside diphosphate kinase
VRIVSQHLPCSPDHAGTLVDRCQRCIYPTPICLTQLPAERVIAAARELLGATAASASAL